MTPDLRTLDDLRQEAANSIAEASGLIARRVNRDAALTHITDAFAALQVLAARIGGRGHGFSERPVKRVDEEDDGEQERALDQHAHQVSILDVLDESDRQITEHEREVARLIRTCDERHAAEHLHEFAKAVMLRVLRAMINYIWHGARNPWEMMKRALAITRRYQRAKLRGISMTEVARLLDEKSRCAAVSARERDTHDELLRRWGVRAPKAADAGLRSDATCERNRQRAKGNSNRRKRKTAPPSRTSHVGSSSRDNHSTLTPTHHEHRN